jgi:hypothetical protein
LLNVQSLGKSSAVHFLDLAELGFHALTHVKCCLTAVAMASAYRVAWPVLNVAAVDLVKRFSVLATIKDKAL